MSTILPKKNHFASKKKIFKGIVENFLFPLFPGTGFSNPAIVAPPKRNRDKLVTAAKGLSQLNLKSPIDNIYCRIHRVQPFLPEEKIVISYFLQSIERLINDWDKPYRSDTANSVMAEFVSCYISADDNEFLQNLISVFTDWSQQTYEGQRISFSIGIDKSAKNAGGVKFMDIIHADFLKLLSNGHDTLLCVSRTGEIIGHKTLNSPSDHNGLFAPIRYATIAQWTKNDNKVAITLNRSGEVCIFKDGNICFAKRRGSWRYFAHTSVLRQFTSNGMGKRTSEQFRKEIYLTALDVAFSRTGGCIGIVNSDKKKKLKLDGIVADQDCFSTKSDNNKVDFLKNIVGGRKFQEIDRLLRLELISIDGSTVIDHEGNFLSVGAILTVTGGSSGGGRQLAAETIAEFGLGIKISNDGYITIIDRDKKMIATLA